MVNEPFSGGGGETTDEGDLFLFIRVALFHVFVLDFVVFLGSGQ
jgi:hypothetical protein